MKAIVDSVTRVLGRRETDNWQRAYEEDGVVVLRDFFTSLRSRYWSL
jgi:hypothetical protein